MYPQPVRTRPEPTIPSTYTSLLSLCPADDITNKDTDIGGCKFMRSTYEK